MELQLDYATAEFALHEDWLGSYAYWLIESIYVVFIYIDSPCLSESVGSHLSRSHGGVIGSLTEPVSASTDHPGSERKGGDQVSGGGDHHRPRRHSVVAVTPGSLL